MLGLYYCSVRTKQTEVAKVLLVEDDPEILRMIRDLLVLEKHTVEAVVDGLDAGLLLASSAFDLIILDWGLPGVSGIDLLRQCRAAGSNVPIIMLTARGDIGDKETGLFSGADDYITKPFDIREFRARVVAALRRSSAYVEDKIEYAHLLLDISSRVVLVNNEEVYLKPREFALLELLLKNQDQAFTLDGLIERIWEADNDVSYDAVRQCVARIRKKVDVEGQESLVTTLPGVGYKISKRTGVKPG